MDSGAQTQNLAMFGGAMATLIAFWLAVLGIQHGSPVQLAGAAVSLAVAVFCFRTYAAALREDRRRREQQP